MKSDTPRTDAEILRLWKGGIAAYVSVDFAKQLERELAHSLANQVKSQAQSHGLARRVVEAEMKLEVSQAEVERLRKQLQQAVDIAEKIWADCSNGSEHTEIAALKSEIK